VGEYDPFTARETAHTSPVSKWLLPVLALDTSLLILALRRDDLRVFNAVASSARLLAPRAVLG
jgi:hypothetical protein